MVYAFNWYNVGAVLPLIGGSLHAGTSDLGIVLGSFLIGVAVFQIPAGFVAIRFGARQVSIGAIAFMGLFGVASAFAPTWEWLALARFGAGAAAAFFFSPALSLVASYYPAGRRGPVIGIYNGGFSIGGAIGLFGGEILGTQFGWPSALLVGGVGLLAMALASVPLLPSEAGAERPKNLSEIWKAGRGVLRSRSIWALSLALTGFWAAVYIVSQYFVQFVHDVHPSWGLAVAAALAAVFVILSFPGGPVGGWLGERGRDRRLLIAVFGAIASAAVLAIPFAPLLALWPLFILLGFVEGVVFAILYLIPSYLPESRGEGLALGVAVVNSIQVFLGSGLAIAFGFVAASHGYVVAWLFAAGVSFGLLPLLLLVTPNRASLSEPIVQAVGAKERLPEGSLLRR